MPLRARVTRGVTVRRAVAAADVPALQAEAQVYPLAADGEALSATVAARRDRGRLRGQVRAKSVHQNAAAAAGVPLSRSAVQRFPSFARYAPWSAVPITHSAIQSAKPSAVRVARWYSWKNS